MSASWKTVRVFISSTFKDMQAERDHLVRFVFPKLREELLKHRIHFVDVDLRWGVTGDEDATEVCREVIGECRPRFLCILGGRYGWVPPGKTKSITADEIEFGVLHPPVNDHGPVRAFFYFRKDEDTQAIPEADACAGGYREFATADEVKRHGLETAEAMARDRAGKLAELKDAIIAAELPVFLYPARWDTAQKRLTGLETFGDQVHADLLRSLKDDPELASRFTESGTEPPDEFQEEAEQMEAFIEERTERYVVGSRQPVLDALEAFASADPAVAEPNILVITGEPGSGKSALLAQFCRSFPTLLHSNTPFLLIPHFIGASTGSTDLRRTLRRLSHDLARAADNTEPLPLDIKELITHFQKLLAEASAKKRVILIFDALNQLDATDGAHWMNWLPRELPPGVRIVASVIAPTKGEKEHQTLDILRNRPDARVESLKPLNESDTLAIIEGYLKRYSKRLSVEQIAALKEKPASNLPLYVLTALEELRTLGTYEEITARIRTLPGDARALFGWILTERLASDPGFRDREGRLCGTMLVGKFAACLGVSRHGLSPAELTALLDPGDPLGNVAALLRLLRPYLMHRGELLDFYHGQFREAAEAAYLQTDNKPDPEKQRPAHQSVATCLQAFADPHRDGQCRDATPHALSELPHHQTRAEAWPDLIATLENIFFLEAKVTHGMAFDLAVDFTAAVDALPTAHVERKRLRLLDEALRRDIHFIARHANDYPQALFQCLWNSAWWYDSREAAPHCDEPRDNREEHQSWVPSSTADKVSGLLEIWRGKREAACPGFRWLRTLHPPFAVLATGQLAALRGHEGAVFSVAFSPDGSQLLSGSWDTTLRLWDARSGKPLAVLRGHDGAVNSVAFSPDGTRLLSGADDKTLRVWDARSGECVTILRGHEGDVDSVAFSPDGSRLLSGSEDKSVRLWDAGSGECLAVLLGHEHSVTSVAFSPNGRSLLSGGGSDRTARLWRVWGDRSVECEDVLEHDGYVAGVVFSNDGSRLLTGGGETMRLWGWSSQGRLAILRVLRGHEKVVTSVAFSSEGSRLLSGSRDNTVRLWDTCNGECLAVLRGHEDWVHSVVFSPDGGRLLSGGDTALRIWDASSGARVPDQRGHHEGSVETLAFSPNGSHLVSGGDFRDKTVRLWETKSGKCVAVLRGHKDGINSVAFSPDGNRLLSGAGQILARSKENSLRLWDAHSGACLAILRHGGAVASLAFSPDGRRIVSGSRDKTIRLWDANRGRIAAFILGRELAVLRGHEATVTCVTFSPDGSQVLSGAGSIVDSKDNSVRLWDARTGKCRAVFRGHEFRVCGVAFSPDGSRLISTDGVTTRIWNARSADCNEIMCSSGNRINALTDKSPRQATWRDGETVVEAAEDGLPEAWFPDGMRKIAAHPAGRLWAGAVNNHVILLRLEEG